MFDIFYKGSKPNLSPHEQAASTIAEARSKSRTEFFWLVDGSKDMRDFDFDWQPVPWESHHTHIFPIQSQFEEFDIVFAPAANIPQVDHYHDRKFLLRKTEEKNWKILKTEAKWEIDPTWAPNPFDPPYIYVFGNPWYSSVEMPTIEYRVPGATEYKYVDDIIATTSIDKKNWKILKTEAEWEIDPTWAPNPFESPYIYVFGNPWYSSVEMPTVEYHVPGATERKYIDDAVLDNKIYTKNWKILKNECEWVLPIDWKPNPFEPPYIYVFGNPWYSAIEMPTLEYHVPGATEYKYVTEAIATVKPNTIKSNWKVLRDESEWVIDYSWAPNPFESPYIYVFGNPWYSAIEMPTIEYRVPGATEYKYVDDKIATTKIDPTHWNILKTECEWEIDPSWRYNPFDPPYIYVFGNPWYSSVEMPTVEYRVPGATEYKYVDDKILLPKLNNRYWKTNVENIDISSIQKWRPNPFESPYIYIFGNQWYGAADMPTVEYHVPGATERKYVIEEVVTLTPTRRYWSVPEEVNAGMIDFSWLPHPKEQPYIYHFSSEFQMSVGLTYTVPGATDIKFETEIPLITRQKDPLAKAGPTSIIQTVSMFFVDMNNKSAAKRFATLQTRYPDIQKIRYMNGWVDTIKRCLSRSVTQKFWVISSENVYDDFNFEWHAQPWQNFMTHVFASQWQKWSDTFLINKNEFSRHVKWAKTLEEFPNLNFVKDQPVYRPDDVYDIYYVDHLNAGSTDRLTQIKIRYPNIKTARYVDNYLSTFKRIISTAETDYIWVINSICDYRKFDFTWQPEPWQAKMLHVFPSDDQKFGDTFYVNVEEFKKQMDNIELLDWYETVNYNTEQVVPRMPMDTVVYESDSLVDAVKSHTFTGPYATFIHKSLNNEHLKFAPSIWRKKDRVIHTFTQSGSVSVVPRDVKGYIGTQMYDFPYILPHKEQFLHDTPLNIVYISNGEPDAERWYDHLTHCAQGRKIHWVKDVNGRAAAYKAAATVSTTPWFFAVFAKLEVNPEFNWDWQPDYLQEQKHYIFHAHNPVNGLEYGHMAVLAYNKELTLATNEYGLDFTLSQKHEVVPLLSATAHYNVSPIITWRTAFRECIKLCNSTDEVSAKRLATWSTIAEGKNAEWSIGGANDAREYYDSVNGDMEKLMLSFEWDWLNALFVEKYGAY